MFGFLRGAPAKKPENEPDPKRAASDSALAVPDNLDDTKQRGTSSVSSSPYNSKSTAANKDKYKDDFQSSGGFENQSVQELENYAAYKSEETTKTVGNCLRIAEDIREDATRTLDMLHQQGDQINRTHNMVADTDKDLAKGEKLLGNLGGMFSMTWKPKKGKEINGPEVTVDTKAKKDRDHAKQKEKLGIAPAPKGSKNYAEPTTCMEKVEIEKQKQDDGLSDLSDILGDLKNMAVDMGSEIEKQNKALDNLSEDVDELNSRVKGANQRARKLLK